MSSFDFYAGRPDAAEFFTGYEWMILWGLVADTYENAAGRASDLGVLAGDALLFRGGDAEVKG